VGWNIYLCCLALFHAAVYEASLAAVLADYQPIQHAIGLFADHREDLRYELEPPEAACVLHKRLSLCLKERADGAPLPPDTASRLLRRGLITETETRGCIRTLCALYADYFSRQRSG
jgi:hypothetical protein